MKKGQFGNGRMLPAFWLYLEWNHVEPNHKKEKRQVEPS